MYTASYKIHKVIISRYSFFHLPGPPKKCLIRGDKLEKLLACVGTEKITKDIDILALHWY